MIIAPSILTADLSNLAESCKQAVDAGLDRLHLDVMDGNFVPNMTFGPPVIKALRNALPDHVIFDAHLMITNAEDCYMDYIDAGCNHLSVHVEAATHLHRLVTAIRGAGATVGVVLNPATSLDAITEILPEIDLVLVMSVNPGFGGQKFMPEVLNKIKELKKIQQEKKLSFDIEIDGGINFENSKIAIEAGANILVSGTTVFKSNNGDIKKNIELLKLK